MDSRKARWIALAGSSGFALLLLAVGWAWIQDRNSESVKMHVGERPTDVPREPSPEPTERSADPERPENWRFHLKPRVADQFFGITQNSRVVYDPWMAMREISNENAEFRWKEHLDGKWVFRTNGLGCREDHDLDDPPRDIRILVAGDSHTCGLCNNSESFPNRLEAALAARRPGKTVEALNTGLGGYHFLNYLGALYRFRDFEPQVFVCAIFGGNDFVDFYWMYLHLMRAKWPATTPEQQKRRDAALELSNDAMGQGLASLDMLRNLPDQRAVVSTAALQMCLEMQRVAALRKVAVVFVYIPCPFELAWPEPVERYTRTRDALELTDADFELISDVADRTLDGLRAQGLNTLDLRPVFAAEPEPPYWRVDFHLSVRGHEVIARELEPIIDSLLARE